MRRLWRTGWMHQTERMIAATFLTDYLGVDWRHGARWFHDTLVDADLAINAMMWQNAGKSGLDQWDVFPARSRPTAPAAGTTRAATRSRAGSPSSRASRKGTGGTGRGRRPILCWRSVGVAAADWDPDVFEPAFGYAEHGRTRVSSRDASCAVPVAHRARPGAPSRALPGGHRRRARAAAAGARTSRMEPGLRRRRGGGLRGATSRMSCDPRTAVTTCSSPEGATKAHAGALLDGVHAQGVLRAHKSSRARAEASHAGFDSLSDNSGLATNSRDNRKADPLELPRAARRLLARPRARSCAVRDRRLGRAAPRTSARPPPHDRRTGGARAVRRRAGARARRDVGRKRAARAERDGTAHSGRARTAACARTRTGGTRPGDKIGANHIGHTHGGGDWGAGVSARKKKKRAPGGGGTNGKKKSEKA